ncbi:MAG: PqqD family protein [Candidatus Omnitrophica bacterium]|nr:PqqD family protein [Candidatus Omnitrophota bacterium]
MTNKSGKEILNLLNQGYSLEKIVDSLTDNYSATDRQIIKNDVVSFIEQLKENNLLISNSITQ